jgi:hypothetical protein
MGASDPLPDPAPSLEESCDDTLRVLDAIDASWQLSSIEW